MNSFITIKTCWLVIMFCCIKANGFTQPPKFAVSFTPAILSPRSLAIQPGFGFSIHKRVFFHNEFAFPVYSFAENKFDRTRMFRIQSEFKYFIYSPVPGRYYSLRVGYTDRKFTDNDEGTYQTSMNRTQKFSYTSTRVKSPVWSIAFVWGREMKRKNDFSFDFFLGLGARFISTRYHSEGLTPVLIGPPGDNLGYPFPAPSWVCDCEVATIHGVAGVRVIKRLD